MADEFEQPDPSEPGSEGGPVKSFLDHLEDLRWVLIKSVTTLAVAMLLCLIAGDYVVGILKWPLERAKVHYPGTNQVVTVTYGTNKLTTLRLTPEQEQALQLETTNRFVALEVEPQILGTNRVLGWRLNPDPTLAESAQHLKIELINLSPAGGFIVAFQVALYGGTVLAAPFIFYFVISFIFPALKMREQKYVHRGLFFGGGAGRLFVGIRECGPFGCRLFVCCLLAFQRVQHFLFCRQRIGNLLLKRTHLFLHHTPSQITPDRQCSQRS